MGSNVAAISGVHQINCIYSDAIIFMKCICIKCNLDGVGRKRERERERERGSFIAMTTECPW